MKDTAALPSADQVVRLVRAFSLIGSAEVRERIIEQIEDLDPKASIAPDLHEASESAH